MKPNELQLLADSLEQVIEAYRAIAGEQPLVEFGGFEVDCAVPALVEHVILQAKAVGDLARLSVTYAPAAAGCARSAMEVGALAAWLSKPSEAHDREGRWLGYFKSLEDFNRNMANELKTLDPNVSRELDETIAKYMKGMCAPRFGKTITLVSKPKMKAMLADLDYEHLYPAYREVCEVIHGGPETINRHRVFHRSRELPMGFEFGVFPDEFDWQTVFRIASWGVAVGGYYSLENFRITNAATAGLLDAHKRLIELLDSLK